MGDMADWMEAKCWDEELSRDSLDEVCPDKKDWQNITWTTADGRAVRVSDMTDEHLVNTLAFVKRQHPFWCTDAMLEPEDGLDIWFLDKEDWSRILRHEMSRRDWVGK